MGKWKSIFLILLLLIPIALGDISSDIDLAKDKVESFIDGENLTVVEGRYASTAEKTAYSYIADQYSEFEVETIKEMDFKPIGGKTLVLIGGPKQNLLTNEILSAGTYSGEKIKLGVGYIELLTGLGGKVIVFSDVGGYANEAKKLAKSPLSSFVPEEFVPLVATGISIGLLWLWKLLAEWTYRIFRFKIADKIMGKVKKKQIKEQFKGIKIAGIRIKIREWISIAVSATVFGASLSYIYLAPDISAFTIVALTIVANMIMYTIRNLVRLIMDRHYNTHTEFHIWWWGALITAVSGWLGNAFCVAGYIATEESKNEEATIFYIINLITFLLFIVFFVWNFITPNVLLQMSMILCISYTLLQMLPMKPFPGKNIYLWKKGLWWMTFLPVAICYILITLV